MQNVQIPPDQMQDPKGKWSPEHSRDCERTPMQWNTNVNAGFAAPHVKPWLPVADDFQTCNVEAEQHDPRSILMLVHALLERRLTSPALTIGSYQSIDQGNDACFVYLRQHNEQCYLVALNISPQDQIVKLPGPLANPVDIVNIRCLHCQHQALEVHHARKKKNRAALQSRSRRR